MAHPDVEQAFRDRLTANFDRCPLVPDGDPNAGSNGGAFLVLQFPFSTSAQTTIGAPDENVYREEGGARFVLSVPRRFQAIADGKQWCVEIAALFRGKEFDGVRTWAPTSPFSDDTNDTGSFYVLTVVVPYSWDLIG